jgi:hypothetical protein
MAGGAGLQSYCRQLGIRFRKLPSDRQSFRCMIEQFLKKVAEESAFFVHPLFMLIILAFNLPVLLRCVINGG